MNRVKVTVPATVTHLGAALNVAGLALGLHVTVDLQIRVDDGLKIGIVGESKAYIPNNFYNAALRGAMRVFQRIEQAPVGLQVGIQNAIPAQVGLGLRTALIVGGLVAANNLIEARLKREELIQMAAEFGLAPPRVITSLLGGLTIYNEHIQDKAAPLFYRNFEVTPLRVVAALPMITNKNYDEVIGQLPDTVSLSDAIFNIGRAALLIEALSHGNHGLLPYVLEDRLHLARCIPHIPAYEAIKQAALKAGALAVTIAGEGPLILVFVHHHGERVLEVVEETFAKLNIEAQTWILGIDRQGVVISAFE